MAVDALRSRWAYSPLLMAIAMLMPGMGLNAIGSWGGTWSLTTRPGRGGRLKASIPGH